ncbi:MAG TPA: LytR C-terminal domain-containing protein [Pseudonocardiaceae bacterium]
MAGLALLGVAVGALLVGLVSLGGDNDGNGGGNGDNGDGGQAAPTSEPGQQPPASTDTGTPAATTETPAATTPAPQPPATTATQAPPPPPPPQPPVALPAVQVLNNSLEEGLAARAADDFRSAGWQISNVGNYRGLIPTSTIYFVPGDGDQEAAARRLGQQFDLRVEPRFEGIRDFPPGLIAIVTKDYGGK